MKRLKRELLEYNVVGDRLQNSLGKKILEKESVSQTTRKLEASRQALKEDIASTIVDRNEIQKAKNRSPVYLTSQD